MYYKYIDSIYSYFQLLLYIAQAFCASSLEANYVHEKKTWLIESIAFLRFKRHLDWYFWKAKLKNLSNILLCTL